MEKIFIGIDPDTDKNGVAIWYKQLKKLELSNLRFFELFSLLSELKTKYDICVIVDAGWLNKSNFHAIGTNKGINAKIGERVGANHETGKKIVEMCEYLCIQNALHKPTKTKAKAAEFAALTGFKGRTNQEVRDAGLLVFGR
jgi:hypothetical protein